jgi:hypothetical protein
MSGFQMSGQYVPSTYLGEKLEVCGQNLNVPSTYLGEKTGSTYRSRYVLGVKINYSDKAAAVTVTVQVGTSSE